MILSTLGAPTRRFLVTAIAISALAGASGAAAEVPAVMVHGYPMVPVVIAGQEHQFVFDTGAEGSAVYPAFAAAMALPTDRSETLVGQTGDAELRTRIIGAISLDGRRAGPIAATELPPRRDGLRLAGIVGLDVVGDATIDLDLPRKRLALLERDAAAALTRRLGRPVLARRMTGGLLAVPVNLDGVSGWGVIDTGARESRVNTVFARRARMAAVDAPVSSISGATQNAMSVTTGRVRSARFLSQGRRETTVRIVDLPVFKTFALGDQPAMLLGIDWLAAHRLVIDVRQGLVWLV